MKKSIVFAALLLCSWAMNAQEIIDLSKGRKAKGVKCETVDCFQSKLHATTTKAKLPNDSIVPVYKTDSNRLVIIMVSKKTNKAYLKYVDKK